MAATARSTDSGARRARLSRLVIGLRAAVASRARAVSSDRALSRGVAHELVRLRRDRDALEAVRPREMPRLDQGWLPPRGSHPGRDGGLRRAQAVLGLATRRGTGARLSTRQL